MSSSILISNKIVLKASNYDQFAVLFPFDISFERTCSYGESLEFEKDAHAGKKLHM